MRKPLLAVTTLALAAVALAQTRPASTESNMDHSLRRYSCTRATGAITIDGKLDDPAWEAAAWSEWFVDIEAESSADAARSIPAPRFKTRMKMLWDDEYLYFAAELEEPHVWGTLTEKNDIIYRDNDFEIFIDPDGDRQNYYEFEINALGTIMELTMNKPYHEKGKYTLGTNLTGLKSAVHVDGTLNDPGDIDRGWSVEVAIPWKDLERFARIMPTPPEAGDAWRINFSRVQWKHEIVDGKYVKVPKEKSVEDNWVWSPIGRVDMHRPEKWGIVTFEK